MFIGLHVKYPFFGGRILMHLEISQQIFEKYPFQISWKSVQWGPNCSMRVGGRTGGDISKSLFEILRTRLRTVRCAVEDDVAFPQRAVLLLSVRHSCWCLGKYSNLVAYLCFSLILCSVFSETVLWAKLRNFRSAVMPCFKSGFV